MEESTQVIFRRQVTTNGTSISVNIPTELLEATKLNKGDEICLKLKTGKKGPYIALWHEDKQ